MNNYEDKTDDRKETGGAAFCREMYDTGMTEFIREVAGTGDKSLIEIADTMIAQRAKEQ